MARQTYTVSVVGTAFGDRNDLIKAFARKGAEVQLRRATRSKDPQAVGVWVKCVRFWGLWKTWALIGFIAPDPAQPWAAWLDARTIRVVRAWVHSSYVPLERETPKVSLRIVVEPGGRDGPPSARANL